MIKKKNKGITLVALVITIIVLLVLAGITIAQLKGNGLFDKAIRAKDESEKQAATEKMNLKITEAEMSSWEKEKRMPTLQELANEFCKNEDDEFEYRAFVNGAKQVIMFKHVVENDEGDDEDGQ